MADRSFSAPTPAARPGKATHNPFDAMRSNASQKPAPPKPVARTCKHPGCGAYATYGLDAVSGLPAEQLGWWCGQHVPDAFWNAKRRDEAARAAPAAAEPAKTETRFKNNQGVLL